MIKLQCRCGHLLSLPDHLAGQKIRCKQCQKVMRVPESRIPDGGADPQRVVSDPAFMVRGSRPCPGCGALYPPGVVVCVECGVNVDTGAMLYVSLDTAAPGALATGERDDEEQAPGFLRRLLGKLGLGG